MRTGTNYDQHVKIDKILQKVLCYNLSSVLKQHLNLMTQFLPIIFDKDYYGDDCVNIAVVGRSMMTDSQELVQALRITPLVISRWVYVPECMFSYPCGKFVCDECNSWCKLSPTLNAYVVVSSSIQECVTNRFKCEKCICKLQQQYHVTTRYLRIKTWFSDCRIEAKQLRQKSTLHKIAKQWKYFIQRRRERHAIAVMKPYLLHWAFKPDGPLVRCLQMSFDKTKKEMLDIKSNEREKK